MELMKSAKILMALGVAGFVAMSSQLSVAAEVIELPSIAAKPAPVAVIPSPKPEQVQFCTSLDIQFEIGKADIKLEDVGDVVSLGKFMNKFPDTVAVIEGNTDNVGDDEQNMQLSQHRAERVVDFLVVHYGVDPSRLKPIGYGKTLPIADNDSEAGRRKNRRVNAVIDCASGNKEGFKPIPGRITMASVDMEFDKGKADIDPKYHDEIRKVADFMQENPTATATVEGHSYKEGGTPEQNMKLSRNRAENVVNYLVEKFGIDRSRLDAVGFGQTRRVAYNMTAEGRKENRRVSILIDYAE